MRKQQQQQPTRPESSSVKVGRALQASSKAEHVTALEDFRTSNNSPMLSKTFFFVCFRPDPRLISRCFVISSPCSRGNKQELSEIVAEFSDGGSSGPRKENKIIYDDFVDMLVVASPR